MSIMVHEKRFLATLIDGGVGLLLTFAFCFGLNHFFKVQLMNFDYYLLFMFTFVMFLYQFLCILIFKNQTLGLYLMSLKLLSTDWFNLNVKQNILRSISISIPVLFIINIAYMFIYGTKNTTLFDDISNSMVVNTGVNYNINQESLIDKLKKNK